ncbi:DUF6456 domain-containing protein [Seohaeicola saemankumensis]|nr:DUF6456 domain-containing protein [Seohaeicola saemankumensis]MCA0872124.1 DUF6456 domain-containing protein [Seohaeicola saemankumensis]
MNELLANTVPGWVPEGARRYLAHTEAGRPIRDLARMAGCHASTVLRQIRRIEMRRDDPLVDAALTALAQAHFPPMTRPAAAAGPGTDKSEEPAKMTVTASDRDDTPDAATLEREGARILRRLCESGAVLAVAEDMDKAVVVRDQAGGVSTRTAVVDCAVAQAMALQDWIACAKPGRISRYHITAGGRAALSRILAEAENRARTRSDGGFAEAQAGFTPASAERAGQGEEETAPRRVRYSSTESPLVALARRRDRDGQPFLDNTLVRAGERLREDFELSQMAPSVTQNWDRFLTGGGRSSQLPEVAVGSGSSGARDRVARALADLGPGLSDVALRCCCYLEGLETAEKRMGWSARSGKIVLRIALQRLKRHYEGPAAADRMIG